MPVVDALSLSLSASGGKEIESIAIARYWFKVESLPKMYEANLNHPGESRN